MVAFRLTSVSVWHSKIIISRFYAAAGKEKFNWLGTRDDNEVITSPLTKVLEGANSVRLLAVITGYC